MRDESPKIYEKPRYITFKEYITAVMENTSRKSEADILIRVFGLETLDRVLSGGKIVQASELVKGMFKGVSA